MSTSLFVWILVILSDLVRSTGTCSSRNAGRTRPSGLTRPNITNVTYPCAGQAGEGFCLNGGTCFTRVENSTDYSCRCRDGYCGMTCGDVSTRFGCSSSSSSSSSSALMMDEDLEGSDVTYPCPVGPAEWLCLNGGTCFTVFENGSDFNCFCSEGYCGLRCAEKYTRYGCFSTYLVISASVASAGCIAACLVVLVIALYIFYESRLVTVNDGELKLYFQQNIELKNFTCSLSLTKFDDLESANSGGGCRAERSQIKNSVAQCDKKQRDIDNISYF